MSDDEPNEIAELLGDDFSGLDKLQNYGIRDVGKLATEYLKAQEHISSSVRAPSENATNEEWAKFYRKLGAPEDVDGYETPDELNSDFKSIVDELKPTAKTLGLTSKQWNALVKSIDQTQAQRLETVKKRIEEQNEKWIAEGKEKYGGEWEAEVGSAIRAFNELTQESPEVREILDATGLGSHPALIEMFAKAQKMSGEHKMADSEDAGAGVPDPEEAAKGMAERIKEIMFNEDFTNRKSEGYTKLQKEFYELQKKLQEMGYKGARDPRLGVDKIPGVPYTLS